MTSSQPAIDIKQLADESLPQADFPSQPKSDFRIHIHPDAHKSVHEHAAEDTSVEICGVLVGRLCRDDNGPFVLITASIRGDAASNKHAEVTFTHETWSKINGEMDTKYTDNSIVGWYHTHPDFGIFLSERDRFILEHFFNGPGQVALVVDPIRKEEGFFIWRGGKPDLTNIFWLGDALQIHTPESAKSQTTAETLPADTSTISQSTVIQSPSRLQQWLTLIPVILAVVLAFMVGRLTTHPAIRSKIVSGRCKGLSPRLPPVVSFDRNWTFTFNRLKSRSGRHSPKF